MYEMTNHRHAENEYPLQNQSVKILYTKIMTTLQCSDTSEEKNKAIVSCNSSQIPIASNCVCVTVLGSFFFFLDKTSDNFRRQDGCIRIEIKALYKSTAFVKKAENGTRLDLEFSK